tara:strand:- start:562 stop:1104 length:543 start_codon:yes stop_codon:yes gene_type:complete
MTIDEINDRAILEEAHLTTLYSPTTGEVIAVRDKKARRIYHTNEPKICKEDIVACKSGEDLGKLLHYYSKFNLYGPIDLNTKLSNRYYENLMLLCKEIVGLNYTFKTIDDLMDLWGCKKTYAYQLINDYSKWGIIKTYHSKWGFLIEINPFYGWRYWSEWLRWYAMRSYSKQYIGGRSDE